MFMKIDKYKMELSQKSVESPICWFHSTGVLHTFVLYNLLGPGTSYYRNKIILKIILFSLNEFSD